MRTARSLQKREGVVDIGDGVVADLNTVCNVQLESNELLFELDSDVGVIVIITVKVQDRKVSLVANGVILQSKEPWLWATGFTAVLSPISDGARAYTGALGQRSDLNSQIARHVTKRSLCAQAISLIVQELVLEACGVHRVAPIETEIHTGRAVGNAKRKITRELGGTRIHTSDGSVGQKTRKLVIRDAYIHEEGLHFFQFDFVLGKGYRRRQGEYQNL